MKRKEFIKKTLSAGLAWGAAGMYFNPLFANGKTRKITILNTNDTHSHFEPFPTDSKYAGLGGIARRETLIKRVRAENPNTLLLDAGDSFEGTPYFEFYKGVLSYKMMSYLGYDAATLGNHEFDNGVSGLVKAAKYAQFPLVCANYNFTETPLSKIVLKYIIKEVDGVKIGIYGLGIDFKGLVSEAHHKGVYYRDPVDISVNMIRRLRDYEQCDMVICLSHLGYEYNDDRICDLKLARLVNGIDLIIGGHTHTFLEKPVVIKKANQNPTLITQVGFGGIVLGRIDFEFDETGHIVDYYADNMVVGKSAKSVNYLENKKRIG